MKKKSILAVVFCILLSFTTLFAGCGGDGKGGKRVELENYTPLYKYKDTVKLSVGQYTTGTYPAGQSPGNNVVYDIYKDVMNIELSTKFSTTWGQPYQDKITNGIQSNDLPDVFHVIPYQLYQLIKFDMVWDLTDLFDRYASDEVKHLLKYNTINMDATSSDTENMLIDGASKNGRMYGLPWVTSKSNGIPVMYIRKDLREAMKEPVPTTTEEVFALAEKFTQTYSKVDKPFYGLDFSNSPNAPYHMYGVYPTMHIKGEDGKYTYGSHDPKVATVTEKLNKLYEEGVINQDYGVTTSDPIASGQVGIAFAEFWHCMGGMQTLVTNHPGVEWEVYQMPGETKDKQVVPGTVPNSQGMFVVSKKCKNPEALIVMYNHVVNTFIGQEGEYAEKMSKLNEDDAYSHGTILSNWAPLRTDAPDKLKGRENAIIEAVEKESPEGLSLSEKSEYDSIMRYVKDGNMSNWWIWYAYKYSLPVVWSYEHAKVTDYREIGTPSMISQAGFINDIETQFMVQGIRGSYDKKKYPTMKDWFDYFVSEQMKVGMKDVLSELNM